jgi:hypothetical protein
MSTDLPIPNDHIPSSISSANISHVHVAPSLSTSSSAAYGPMTTGVAGSNARPNSTEVYGFVLWISTFVAFAGFILWAYLPESTLIDLGESTPMHNREYCYSFSLHASC